MELMVPARSLEYLVAVGVLFCERDEVPDQLQEMLLLEHASDEDLQCNVPLSPCSLIQYLDQSLKHIPCAPSMSHSSGARRH